MAMAAMFATELITMMEIIELDICLTKGAWLNKVVPHPSLIVKELMKDITNGIESNLMVRHWMDCSNRNIGITAGTPTKDDSGHRLLILHHHTIDASGDERRWINELERHGASPSSVDGRYCSLVGVLLLCWNMMG
jgi:hypothetical protein